MTETIVRWALTLDGEVKREETEWQEVPKGTTNAYPLPGHDADKFYLRVNSDQSIVLVTFEPSKETKWVTNPLGRLVEVPVSVAMPMAFYKWFELPLKAGYKLLAEKEAIKLLKARPVESALHIGTGPDAKPKDDKPKGKAS